jgi:prepilin-type N-terminal cleavage/methylation domain-containing protein
LDDAGFTLVEVLIAMLVLVVGLLSVAQLLAVSIVMNSDARSATSATLQAQTKVDELMKTSFTAPMVQINAADTLSSNVANYFDTPTAGITRRWQVTAGPSGTRTVTVRVLAARGRVYGRSVEMTTRIRQW